GHLLRRGLLGPHTQRLQQPRRSEAIWALWMPRILDTSWTCLLMFLQVCEPQAPCCDAARIRGTRNLALGDGETCPLMFRYASDRANAANGWRPGERSHTPASSGRRGGSWAAIRNLLWRTGILGPQAQHPQHVGERLLLGQAQGERGRLAFPVHLRLPHRADT